MRTLRQADRLDLVGVAREYAGRLGKVRADGVRGGEHHRSVVGAEELLRQLANILEGATCLDETEK